MLFTVLRGAARDLDNVGKITKFPFPLRLDNSNLKQQLRTHTHTRLFSRAYFIKGNCKTLLGEKMETRARALRLISRVTLSPRVGRLSQKCPIPSFFAADFRSSAQKFA